MVFWRLVAKNGTKASLAQKYFSAGMEICSFVVIGGCYLMSHFEIWAINARLPGLTLSLASR
jgi:hypothetical protein